MAQDGLLSNFYEEGMGLLASNRWIGRMARQVAHRYPHIHIFEIGMKFMIRNRSSSLALTF